MSDSITRHRKDRCLNLDAAVLLELVILEIRFSSFESCGSFDVIKSECISCITNERLLCLNRIFLLL